MMPRSEAPASVATAGRLSNELCPRATRTDGRCGPSLYGGRAGPSRPTSAFTDPTASKGSWLGRGLNRTHSTGGVHSADFELTGDEFVGSPSIRETRFLSAMREESAGRFVACTWLTGTWTFARIAVVLARGWLRLPRWSVVGRGASPGSGPGSSAEGTRSRFRSPIPGFR
jgi:hypothetical protein